MLLLISIFAGCASLAAILLFWRLKYATRQLAELKSALERGTGITDSVFADLAKAQSELAWFSECHGAAASASEQGYWEWHPARDQWHFSAAFKKLLGCDDVEMESSLATLQALLHPEDKERVVSRLREFGASLKTRFDVQYRMRHRNGAYRWFHSRGARVSDQKGEGEVLVAIQQDITEAKQMESAMMESQMRFRCLHETAPICFVQWDLEGRIMDWNKHAERIFGWSKSEITGRPIIKLFAELHQEIFLESAHKLIAGVATTSQLTCVNLSKADAILYLEWTSVVLRSLKGTIIGVISLGIDVTARKREEDELLQYRFKLQALVDERTRELEEARDSLSQIIEGTPLATFVVDAEHVVRYWNKACEILLGAPAREVVGKPAGVLASLIYGNDRDLLSEIVLRNDEQRIAEAFGESAWRSSFAPGAYCAEVFSPPRNLWLSVTATPLRDPNGQVIGVITTMEDISPRKLAAEKLLEAKQLAEQAAQSKADFLANMSHEIRTPMNAIIGLTHLALKTALQPKQRDYLERISGAGTMLSSLVNDVLDFSKIEAGKMTLEQSPFMLDEILISTSTMVSTRAQDKGLELRYCVDPDVPAELIGDSLRLTQVLVNLVGNAIKFTERGRVAINVKVAERGADSVCLAFDVTDTGIGMTPEQASRLFQAFTQADTSTTRKYGGTGLGLIICKRIIELMGGEISLTSEVGRGTTFSFSAAFGAPVREVGESLIPASVRGGRVLIVDDDQTWCEMFHRMLLKLGFRSEFTTSPESALVRLAPGHGDGYAMAFIDWRMPGMDGIELARRIRSAYGSAKAPVLVIVSMSELQELEQAIGDLSIAGVLIKPVTTLHVTNLITGLFDPQASNLLKQLRAQTKEYSLGGLRVLVVDDIATNQMIATELLAEQGVDVHIAGSGAEAIAALEADATPYDMVLMDIQMPEMDGYEATRRIRADVRFQTIPIIAMTAHAMDTEREKCRVAGMNDFVTKPIAPDQLFRVMARWTGDSGQPTASGRIDAVAPVVEAPPPMLRSVPFAQLRGIDTALGLQFMMNKPAVYEKVLKDFYLRFKDTVNDVRLAIARGDHGEAQRQAHSLKSLASSIGATALSAAARELESALSENRAPDSGVIETFEESMIEVLEGLSDQFMIQ